MKKILLVLLALTLGVGVTVAQDNKKAKKTEVVKFTTNLDCESCANKVLNVIPFKKGVKDVVVDVPTKVVEVTFDPRKTSAEKLEAELEKIDVKVVDPCAEQCCDGHDHHGHDHSGHNHDHAGHSHTH